MMKRVMILLGGFLLMLVFFACGPKQTETEPAVPTEGEVPSKPLLDVEKDAQIDKAFQVIISLGKKTQSHQSYREYLSKSQGGQNQFAFTPSWFYDSYMLKTTDSGYWIKVFLNSAQKAVEEDQRVKTLMSGLPLQVIDVELLTPQGTTYLLSDNEADGVLDFAQKKGQKPMVSSITPDLDLLKKMQVKYAWILGIIKKYYKPK